MRLHFFTARLLRCLVLLFLAFALFAFAGPARAADYAWRGDGSANEWDNPSNYAPNGTPASGDRIVFDATTANPLVLDAAFPDGITFAAIGLDQAIAISGPASLALSGTPLFNCSGAAAGGYFSLYFGITLSADSSLVGGPAGQALAIGREVDNNGNLLTTSGDVSFYAGLSGAGGLAIAGGTTQFANYSASHTGTTTINNGAVLQLLMDEMLPNADSVVVDAGGTLDLNGNTETIGSLTGAAGAQVQLGSGTLTTGGNDSDSTFDGVISGSGGSLIKSGLGILLLRGANTYTGATTVNGGAINATGGINRLPTTTVLEIASGAVYRSGSDQTLAGLSGSGTLGIYTSLFINEAGSRTFDGAINSGAGAVNFFMQGTGTLTLNGNLALLVGLRVANGTLALNGKAYGQITVSGGTLMGTGTAYNYTVTVTNGYFSPGNSVGTFTCDNNLIMQAASDLKIEVNGATGDQVIVNGTVTLNSPTLSISGTPTIGAVFTIINNDAADAVSGTFAGLAEGATFTSNGHKYRITYQGGTGNDVVLTCLDTPPAPAPTPTPEPEPEPDTPPAPSVPQGSGPSPTGSLDGTALSWPQVKGATHYRIYRADCPLCPRREIGRTKENSFVDNTAIPGQPYAYWLRSENNDGPGVYSNWMAAWRYEQNPGRAGDFNGDGVMDLLWWDRATGQVYIWFMNGGQVMNVSAPMEGLDVSQWLLIGTSDFNGDGACDLLWWKPETGEILFWYMQPAMATASAPFQAMSDPISQTMPAHAAIAYPGDLNGDGYSDILWRNYSTGEVTIWLMGADGKPMLSGPPVPVDETITRGERPGLSGALQWQVAGLSDANGDGKADVIWQDERNNRLVTWLMDGANILRAVEETKGLDTVWRLAGVGDLNMDGHADIVWRNEASGEIKAWLMQAGKFLEERAIKEGSEEATQWQVKAVGDFCAPGCDDLYCKHSESSAAKIVTLDGREFTPTVE